MRDCVSMARFNSFVFFFFFLSYDDLGLRKGYIDFISNFFWGKLCFRASKCALSDAEMAFEN